MFHSSFYNNTVLVLDVTQVSKTEAFSLLCTPEHGTYCINYYILHMNINNKVYFIFLLFFFAPDVAAVVRVGCSRSLNVTPFPSYCVILVKLSLLAGGVSV